MNERRILVTGGAGFIGVRTVWQLAQRAQTKIWVLDSLHPQVHGEGATPPNFSENVTFVKGDVCDRPLVHQLLTLAQPTLVIHMAAETGRSMDRMERHCRVNVTGTAILLEEITQTKAPLQKFILMSSRAVYGEGAYWDATHRQSIVPPPRQAKDMAAGRFEHRIKSRKLSPAPTPEGTPPAPASIHASTKLMQEHLVQQAGVQQPWNAITFRLQNVYGPGQSLKRPNQGVLSTFSSQILAGQRLNIYEDGQARRDFVFIDDAVKAIALACDIELPHGTIFNIGSGQGTPILEVARMLLRLYGKSPDAYTITGDFRAGDVRYAVADIQRAQQLLNWRPQVSLAQGLTQLTDTYRQAAVTTIT